MSEQTLQKGDNVRHVKSTGRSHWHSELTNGNVTDISSTGKRAEVMWLGKHGHCIHSAWYPVSSLIKI